MLVLATLCWSVSFATMRALSLSQQHELTGASTWFISSYCVALRFGLASAIMLLWCIRTVRGLTGSEFWQGLGLGVFGSAGLILQMDGLAHTDASVSAFLTQCYCLIIPFWIALLERRWPSRPVIVSCLLVMVGVAVLARVDWQSMRLGRGELETLLGSVFFTGQILWLQRPCYARNNVNHFSLVMFVVMTFCALGLAVASQHQPGHWVRAYAAPASWVLMAVLVVISTLGGYLLMNAWQPRLGATEAGLIYCAEPVFASLFGLFLPALLGGLVGINYPNETVGLRLLLGGGLITVANLWLQVAPPLAGRPRVPEGAAEAA